MGLISQSIKNLKGGISQQPEILRYPNQGVQQINGWSSETQGLQKRPPSVFVKNLGARGMYGLRPLIHLVNRDAVEQYYMIFTTGGPQVVDLMGRSYEVRGYDGYADCSDPRNDLRLLTVADYTFVVNRKRVVKTSPGLTHEGYPALDSRCLIAVRGGQYGRMLTIYVNDVKLCEYQLPPGMGTSPGIEDQVRQMDAQAIAKELTKRINEGTATHGRTAEALPSAIMITGGEPMETLKTEDGYGDQLINGFIYQVQTFTKLPNSAPANYLVEITGEASRSGDNYWVRYDAKGKVWKETVKPGILSGVDPATMPKGLVRAADGNFDWKTLEWVGRAAGDDETNPMPSFVDNTINDVFFFRNRLGFLSGENVILSRSSRYFNFFPPSVSALSDDDPLDIAVSHNRVSILKYAVPFSEQLLLWSDQAQFVLTSSGVLSPKSVELNLTTEFDVLDSARPFGLGRGVYFSAPRASFTSLKRYYAVQDVSDVKNAEDVSGHVPSYIKNRVFDIQGSGTENYVTLLSDTSESRVFVYKFLYLDDQLAQQSWSHWEFGTDSRVLAAASIGSFMYLIVERHEGIILERIEFTQFTTDFITEPYRTYMDSKSVKDCEDYSDDNNESYLELEDIYGGIPSDTDSFWTIDPSGAAKLHSAPEGGWASDSRLVINGDQRGVDFVVGRQTTFTYQFSKFLIKQTAEDGTTSTEDTGRLQLRNVKLNYENSGAFTAFVNNGSSEYSYVMTGGRIGNEVLLGELNLGSGQYRIPMTGNAQRLELMITSDVPSPLTIIGCSFEGNYVRRTSGV